MNAKIVLLIKSVCSDAPRTHITSTETSATGIVYANLQKD